MSSYYKSYNRSKDFYFLGDLGRLAFKEEPGKVRVFAIVDCVTQ
jgi:hypothetical protein